MDRWVGLRVLVPTIVIAIVVIAMAVYLNGNQLHANGMEAYHLKIEYSELRLRENVTCHEISMIEEALFVVFFELDPGWNYQIRYGHFNGKFVYDTRTIKVNFSAKEYIGDFYFHDEALVGLFCTNRFCCSDALILIYVLKN